MGNTVAQWQEAKNALVAQSNQLSDQYASLKREGSQLAFQSADIYKQLKVTEDPVKRAQLQSQFDSVQSQLQQNNIKAEQTQEQQSKIGDQILTTNNEINNIANSGKNATMPPVSQSPGNGSDPAPQSPLAAASNPTPEPVTPTLRVEVSPIGNGEFSYDIVNVEKGKIIKSFNSQAEANAYTASPAAAAGVTPPVQNTLVNKQLSQVVPASDSGGVTQNSVYDTDTTGSTGVAYAATAETKTVMGFANSASSYDEAEAQAKAEAISVANDLYGVNGWTQTSFAEVKVRANSEMVRQKDGSYKDVITGYTGTYELRVDPVEPPPPPPPPPPPSLKPPVVEEEKKKDDPPPPPPGEKKEDPPKPEKITPPPVVIPVPTKPKPPPQDWRIRISISESAKYSYYAPNPGILFPLKATRGVIFPYTPSIQVNYSAKYDSQLPAHSNYQLHSYQGSAVESVTITGDFTAQSVAEANYLLAVIHFFRTSTKMFYGQDPSTLRGAPPPLLYLSGYGKYQFDHHPMVLTSFNYSLPQDVDYIDAYSDDQGGAGVTNNGILMSNFQKDDHSKDLRGNAAAASNLVRLMTGKTKLNPGGKITPTKFVSNNSMISDVTRVPTKISIALSLLPIVTRRAITDKFSLTEYATGKLLRGDNPGTGGGIW